VSTLTRNVPLDNSNTVQMLLYQESYLGEIKIENEISASGLGR
jgi:hypothetical protein